MKKIWILSQHRTGSGYFCEILGSILNKNFSEFLAPWRFDFEYIKTNQIEKLVDKSLKNYVLPDYSKIHYDTMKEMFGNFYNFKKQLGNARFIRTARKNLIEHSVSLYCAIYLNKWRIESEVDKNKNWDFCDIEIENKNLLSCYFYLKKNQNCWEIGEDYLTVYYEDLIRDTPNKVEEVLVFLGVKKTKLEISKSIDLANKNIIRQTHNNKKNIKERLEKLIKLKHI